MRADEAAALVPKDGWQRLRCAGGSKGPRLCDWALIGTAAPGHCLLIRRSLAPARKARSSRRSSAAGHRAPSPCPSSSPWRGRAGESRTASPRPGARPGWTTTRSASTGPVPARHLVHARARVPRRHRPRLLPAAATGPPPLKRGSDACGQRFAPPRTYAPPAFVTDETGGGLIPLAAAGARRLFNLRTRVTRPAEFHGQWPAWRRRRQQIPLRPKTQMRGTDLLEQRELAFSG
jgi:hypothetical protein